MIDTVAYTNLAPNTKYTVSGELFDKSTGKGTGIVGSATFTSSATGSGTVDVLFIINEKWAGKTLVAFEVLTQATAQGTVEIASHEDINDAAQTIVVKTAGALPSTGLGEGTLPLAVGGVSALLAGSALLMLNRKRSRLNG